jgi:L-fuconolactonase
MPNFPIVDSHVHLYDVGQFRYSWLEGVPKINRTSLLEDFDRARAAVEVDRIVFAEVAIDSGLNLQEANFVQALANKDPRLCGMIAHVPLEKGSAVEADTWP